MRKRIFKASAFALALGCTLTLVICLSMFMDFYNDFFLLFLCMLSGAFIGVILVSMLVYYSFSKEISLIDTIISKSVKLSSGKNKYFLYDKKDCEEMKNFTESMNKYLSCLYAQIDSQKRHQDALVSVINNIDQGIILLDKNKDVKIINDKALYMLNRSFASNKDIKDCEIYFSHLVPMCDTVIKTGKFINTKLDLIENDKSINIYASLFDTNNIDQGVFILITDTTEVNKLQKMRDEFAANVTHELKTPLTSIVGFIELLKNGNHDEETRKYFYNVIDTEAQRLFHLIDDMLLLAQIENMNDSIYTQKCDVKKEIQESLNHLIPLAKNNNIEIDFSAEEDLFVDASSIRLQQLFSNIIGNAIKYNFANGRIDIKLYREKDMIVTKIKDTGIGIAPEHIDKIFERFFRSDKSRASEVRGTGLGLAISKDIVSMYGGEIRVNSDVGKGSEFVISFPSSNK